MECKKADGTNSESHAVQQLMMNQERSVLSFPVKHAEAAIKMMLLSDKKLLQEFADESAQIIISTSHFNPLTHSLFQSKT